MPGEPDVEHDQVDRRAPGGRLERARTVLADLDLVALTAQGARERLGDRLVVLGEEHARHSGIVGTS